MFVLTTATASNALNVPQKEVYYFGIIDILQPYNLRKRVEHALKSVIEGEEAMSCVDPDTYASRFQAFLVYVLVSHIDIELYPSSFFSLNNSHCRQKLLEMPAAD